MIKTPYLLFIGDAPDQLAIKVAQGIVDWRPAHALGQLALPGCGATLPLPALSLAEAYAAGARTLVIGVANRGGVISPAWKSVLCEALALGFDLAAGLHNHLADEPDLVAVARAHGRSLHDVRKPRGPFPIATGERRSGRRCLAVGTDCSVGKMYTALAMDAEMRARGLSSAVRATGQTGILILGEGVPLDAVVADFMAGAIEQLSPAADAAHWDHIEGQGSLFHPSYAGVTLALIHGAQPDALILAHEPTRTHLRGLPGRALPSLPALRELALTTARMVNPDCEVAGVSVNTQHLDEAGARRCLDGIEQALALPAVDPFRHGAGRLVDAVLRLGQP